MKFENHRFKGVSDTYALSSVAIFFSLWILLFSLNSANAKSKLNTAGYQYQVHTTELLNISHSLVENNYWVDQEIIHGDKLIQLLQKNHKQSFHLFSHGRPGELFIKGEWLGANDIVLFLKSNIPNLSSQYSTLNIYGCNFARGQKGKQTVEFLEQVLGISIAASSNITGNDGDWVLETKNINISCLASYGFNLQDTDGDGEADATDIDDDNDGILDADESIPETVAGITDENIQAGALSLINDGDFTADNGIAMNNTAHYFVLDLGESLGNASVVTFDWWTNGGTNRQHTISQVATSTTTATGSNTLVQNYPDGASQNTFTYTISGSAQYLLVEMTSRDGGRVEILEARNTTITNILDNDNDGVADRLDLDSDNDGIFDIVEAGGTDANNDGVVDGVFSDGDNDGWSDVFDSDDGGTALTDPDTDGDGIPDRIDLNSDGDICNDVIEAGFTDGNDDGILGPIPVTVDGDGVVTSGSDGYTGTDAIVTDATIVSVSCDTDGDGIAPGEDIDDDNDGVLDVDEGGLETIAGITDEVTGGGALALINDGDISADNGVVMNSTAHYFVLDLGTSLSNGSVVTFDWWSNNGNNRDHTISQVASGTTTTTGSNTLVQNYPDAGSQGTYTYTISGSAQYLLVEMTSRDGGRIEILEVRNTTIIVDSDYDGITDALDLDSDNDGIFDIVEAGGTDTDNDGIVDGVFSDGDNDGWSDVFDSDDGGSALSDPDTDSDGLEDRIDLNSDGDICNDVIEAGFTDGDDDGVLGSNPVTVDADGVVTSGSDGYTGTDAIVTDASLVSISCDTDGDGVAPAQDIDDDNDGVLDVDELGPETIAGITDDNIQSGPLSLINDGDATADNGVAMNSAAHYFVLDLGVTLQDGSVVTFDWWINNGNNRQHTISQVATATTTTTGSNVLVENYGNTQSQGSYTYTISGSTRYILVDMTDRGGGRVEILEVTNTTANVDSDNDGVTDELDLDSDNDGIFDIVEAGGTDANNDGIVDGVFSDGDSDGWSDVFDSDDGGTALTDPDTDGDGLEDRVDLNSDGDNCDDVKEAGFTDGNNDGILGSNPVTVDSDGVVTSGSDGYTGTDPFVTDDLSIPVGCDTDGDGVLPAVDLDDDNDGILDLDELGPQRVAGITDENIQAGVLSLINDGDITGDNGIAMNSINHYFVLDLGSTHFNGSVITFDWWTNGGTDRQHTISQVATAITSTTGVNTLVQNYPDGASQGSYTYTISGSAQYLLVDMTSRTGGRVEILEATNTTAFIDTDGDGFEDALDLDTDNDGIQDIIEAGGVDADGDGVVDGVFSDGDGDGWSDVFDSDDGGVALSDPDFDGDGINNRADLDSDNDGITDNVEAQTTAAFAAPSGNDTDGDGFDDSYDSDDGGTAITLSNNDGAGDPDYLDLDSDGDGEVDLGEGFDDNNTLEAQDDFEARATAFEAAAGAPGFYVNSDDADLNNLPDWLEDDDGDDIRNFVDPDNVLFFDTDNDGLIDLFDTDNFGLPSNTPDNDGDGEFDFRDTDDLVVLPIELIYFDAVPMSDGTVKLYWTTGSELNNDFFTIERSLNGYDWETVSMVKGAGNSIDELNYTSFDTKPYPNISYYRLKQTDYDGKFEFSNVVSVNINSKVRNTVRVYPNPSKHSITVNGKQEEIAQIRILNALGQEVTNLVSINANNVSSVEIDLSKLSYGIYYLITKTNVKKVIKN